MVRVILAIVVIVLSSYSLITETELMPYYMFFLGALILVTGLAELQIRSFYERVNLKTSSAALTYPPASRNDRLIFFAFSL